MTGNSGNTVSMGLIRDLCLPQTAVVANGNEDLFARLQQELPFDLLRYESGRNVNGWVTPDNWIVDRADLFQDGQKIFDGRENSLGVGYYSKSFQGELSRTEIQPHLVSNPDLPDAYMFHCMWQYRPWDADWVLSMPHRIVNAMGQGPLKVDLQTRYEAGEMLVGACHLDGESEKTIVLNSNSCHPHMANDGFAGTAVMVALMQWLQQQNTYYSYRLVVGPEHLGSVYYLHDLDPADRARLVTGIFQEMPGTDGAIKATHTYKGGQILDQALENALRFYADSHEIVPWRQGAGNDETVWEAPGYEIPFSEVTRCEDQFAPFHEYHSSFDTPDLMQQKKLDNMLEALKQTISNIENNYTATRRFNGLLALSNPKWDLYMERPDPTVEKNLDEDAEKWGHLVDSLLRYFDGSMSVLDIANKHDLPANRIFRYVQRFADHGLVDLARAEVPFPNALWIEDKDSLS